MSIVKKPDSKVKDSKEEPEVIWGELSKSKGNWFQVPLVVCEYFSELGITPGEFLLLMVLEAARFRKRVPAFYWEVLANRCGVSKSTVRRWGYSLKEKGLIRIRPQKKRDGRRRRVGSRNDRNLFYLEPFEDRIEELAMKKEKKRSKSRSQSKRSHKSGNS